MLTALTMQLSVRSPSTMTIMFIVPHFMGGKALCFEAISSPAVAAKWTPAVAIAVKVMSSNLLVAMSTFFILAAVIIPTSWSWGMPKFSVSFCK